MLLLSQTVGRVHHHPPPPIDVDNGSSGVPRVMLHRRVLERDFGEAGKLLHCQFLEIPANVEILIMLLRGAPGIIPDSIPYLSSDAYEAAIIPAGL